MANRGQAKAALRQMPQDYYEISFARCSLCGKNAYATEKDAEMVVAHRGVRGLRVYYNEACRSWHLTSK